MKGITHATTGAAAGAVFATAAGFDLPTAIATVGLTAGAAMLPDFDHPSASPAQMYGPVTRGLARALSAISGGHRKATHMIFAPLLFALGIWAAIVFIPNQWGAYGSVFLLTSLAFTGLWRLDKKLRVLFPLLSAAVTWYAVTSGLGVGDSSLFVAECVALGVAAHMLGDALTESGIPLFGPIPVNGKPWKRISLIPAPLQHKGIFISTGAWDLINRVAAIAVFACATGVYFNLLAL